MQIKIIKIIFDGLTFYLFIILNFINNNMKYDNEKDHIGLGWSSRECKPGIGNPCKYYKVAPPPVEI